MRASPLFRSSVGHLDWDHEERSLRLILIYIHLPEIWAGGQLQEAVSELVTHPAVKTMEIGAWTWDDEFGEAPRSRLCTIKNDTGIRIQDLLKLRRRSTSRT